VKIFRITLTGSALANDILSDTPENRAKAAGNLSLVPTKDLVDDMAEKLAATVPEEKREAFKSLLTKHFDLEALLAAQKQSLAKIFTVGGT
jgi:hypothetical protein